MFSNESRHKVVNFTLPGHSTQIDTVLTQDRLEKRQNYMGISKNSGTPKSSISIGFSIINHPFWGTRGTPIFGNTHIPSPSLTWKLNMIVSRRNLVFQGAIFRFHVRLWEGTLPETNSSHLKMDGWNTTFLLWEAYFQGLC